MARQQQEVWDQPDYRKQSQRDKEEQVGRRNGMEEEKTENSEVERTDGILWCRWVMMECHSGRAFSSSHAHNSPSRTLLFALGVNAC